MNYYDRERVMLEWEIVKGADARLGDKTVFSIEITDDPEYSRLLIHYERQRSIYSLGIFSDDPKVQHKYLMKTGERPFQLLKPDNCPDPLFHFSQLLIRAYSGEELRPAIEDLLVFKRILYPESDT